MKHRDVGLQGRRGFLVQLAALAVPVSAGSATPYRPPRNSLGQPDLEGIWSTNSGTGLERPKAFKELWTTPAEARAFLDKRRAMPPPPERDAVGQATTEWFNFVPMTEVGGRTLTSFIVDPADGQLPYSDKGRAKMEALSKSTEEDVSGPEARDVFERCMGNAIGPPLLSIPFGALFQIVQTRDCVAITAELVHETRIIPFRQKHGPAGMRSWTGDAVARWEGETL